VVELSIDSNSWRSYFFLFLERLLQTFSLVLRTAACPLLKNPSEPKIFPKCPFSSVHTVVIFYKYVASKSVLNSVPWDTLMGPRGLTSIVFVWGGGVKAAVFYTLTVHSGQKPKRYDVHVNVKGV
jgi:hypothetical protein